MTEATVTISADKIVTIHYTLTGDDGEVIDRSGKEPLAYLHGHDNIVPGLEGQMAGKKVGDKFKAVVSPAEGYGERLPDAEKQIPREAFPPEMPLHAGAQLAAEDPDGSLIPMFVLAVEDDHVLVDLNHPLAGKTLTFDIEVVGIRDSTEDERSHGHAHGHGGAH